MNKTSTLHLVVTFQKSVTSPIIVHKQLITFFEEFNERNKFSCRVLASDECRTIDTDLIYQHGFAEFDVTLHYFDCPDNFHAGDQLNKMGRDWCDSSKNPLSRLWLRLSKRSELVNKGKPSHPDVPVKEIAFGTLPTTDTFMHHYEHKSASRSKELMGTFLHNQKNFIIYFCVNHTPNAQKQCPNVGYTYKFIVNYNSICKVIFNDVANDSGGVEMFFVLKHLPFVYVEKKPRNSENANESIESQQLATDQEYQERKWERSLNFGCSCDNSYCHIQSVGKCPVFKIVVSRKLRAYGIAERLMQRCVANTYFFYSGLSTTMLNSQIPDFGTFPFDDEAHNSIIDRAAIADKKFACQYAWEVATDRTSDIHDQLSMSSDTVEEWRKVKLLLKQMSTTNLDALVNALYHISEWVFKAEVFSFQKAFPKVYDHYCRNVPRTELPEGMCFVRRLIITPSRTLCLPPVEHFDNRIIREYGTEYLLRTSLQDDNFSKLTFAVQYHTRKESFMDDVVRNLLRNNVRIGPRTYEVLAASNSQLREHGLWLFAKDRKGTTAADIRKWMGDFSRIKNVAKYMARMGQCFSTSEEAVQIELKESEVVKVPDVRTADEGFVFSDGIGMISTQLAQEVRKALSERVQIRMDESGGLYDPRAFQIRFKGCKGMVSENPHLEGRVLAIRPSMEKFPCYSSNMLEVVKITAPRGLLLNRPLISILEQLGVRQNVFVRLQKDMLLDMTNSLIYERNAWRMLSNLTALDYPYKKLLKAGICLTQEPFFRSLLLCVYKNAIDQLRTKARIAVPPDSGRNMMGVMDETNTLEYGQVFVQYSEELGNNRSRTHILERTVVVTKNPCMHPGDVRKLQAVNVEALHHIKDCIVFPMKGKRPHPDEMAGSDLDGDEYVVIWYDDLMFPSENYEPMNYPPNPEEIHDEPITVNDMINFLCKYIQNDNIGVLASAHLAWADCSPSGIFSKVCMSIAKKYPLVLDFAKSGYTCYLKSEERPKMYPDFMEKGCANNSYKSSKALGLLYRTVRNLEACVSRVDYGKSAAVLDPNLVYSGWEDYESSAEYDGRDYCKRVGNILKKYGLSSEAEALTGYFGRMNEYHENRYERDNALQVARTYILDCIKRFRVRFLKAHDVECRAKNPTRVEKQEMLFRRASAWYVVTYQNTDSNVLSFPWVVHDVLCDLRVKVLKEKHLPPSIPSSSFVESSDNAFRAERDAYHKHLDGTCFCVMVLHSGVQNWMTKSSLNLTLSAETSCMSCFERIMQNFLKSRNPPCCSKGSCGCSAYCSPTSLLLDFFKFYSSELCYQLGACGDCPGFQDLNLQSVALKAYASLALTKDVHYLGLSDHPSVDLGDANEEEGDAVRVKVSQDFEHLYMNHSEEVKDVLKSMSGVSELFVTPDKDHRGAWYILVNSIGIGYQRWHLEELIMDEQIVGMIKSRLKIT